MYLHIIWLVAPFVSGTVDQPGNIQNESPTEHSGHEPGVRPALTPEIDGCNCWNKEAGNWHQQHVISEI